MAEGVLIELSVDVVKAVRCPVPVRFIRHVLRAAWSVAGHSEASELGVRVTGDRELRRLNLQFLGIDEVTDVLSFPAGPGAYLGDLALSWPAVRRQAAEYGHPEEAELALLLVHGLLHLLGRDHATASEERDMWAETTHCLSAAGVVIAGRRLAPAASSPAP